MCYSLSDILHLKFQQLYVVKSYIKFILQTDEIQLTYFLILIIVCCIVAGIPNLMSREKLNDNLEQPFK